MKNITPTTFAKLTAKASSLWAHCKKNPADPLLIIIGAIVMDIENSIDAIEEGV
jgi:hypothetical protein